jgi:hypothetical protein
VAAAIVANVAVSADLAKSVVYWTPMMVQAGHYLLSRLTNSADPVTCLASHDVVTLSVVAGWMSLSI